MVSFLRISQDHNEASIGVKKAVHHGIEPKTGKGCIKLAGSRSDSRGLGFSIKRRISLM